MQKRFSIVLPSRNRIKYVKALLTSIIDETLELSQVEVFIGIDYDDDHEGYLKCIKEYSNKVDIKTMIRTRSPNITDDYWNMMMRASTGQFIWIMNDDCVIKSRWWDERFNAAIANTPYEVYILKPYGVGVTKDSVCGFPVMPRKVFEFKKYFFPKQCFGVGCEWMLNDAFSSLNRVIHIPEVLLWHENHSNDLYDETHHSMLTNSIGECARDEKLTQVEKEKIKEAIALFEHD